MMTQVHLKQKFLEWLEEDQGVHDVRACDPYEAFQHVEIFAAMIADDEFEDIDSDRELGPRGHDQTKLEADIAKTIGLKVYAYSEFTESQEVKWVQR